MRLNIFKTKNKIPDGYVIMEVPFCTQLVDESNFLTEGFESLGEGKKWSDNICGLACLKMIIKRFFPKSDVNLSDLLKQGLKLGAYQEDSGWIHQGLINIAKYWGLLGKREKFFSNLEKIAEQLLLGNLVVVSVTPGFEVEGNYSRGGHLVVVAGFVAKNNKVEKLIIHHPSSWKDYNWQNHEVDRKIFLKATYKDGNMIVFYKK